MAGVVVVSKITVVLVAALLAGCGVTVASLEGKSPSERARIVCADTPVVKDALGQERRNLSQAREHEQAARQGYREVRECRRVEEQKAVTTTCTEKDNTSECRTEIETEDVRRCDTVIVQVDRSYEERLARNARSRARTQRVRADDYFEWCAGTVMDLSPEAQVQWLKSL